MIAKYLKDESLLILDVGAKGRLFELPQLSRHSRYLAFEPNPEEFNKLASTELVKYFPMALAQSSGKRELNVTRHNSYSSFLEFDSKNFHRHLHMMRDYDKWKAGMEVAYKEYVPTSSLDDLLKSEKISWVDLIKLDTQGTELEILKGAQTALENRQVGLIHAEVSFMQSYKGQNLFSDLELFLRSKGYHFVDCLFYPQVSDEVSLSYSKKTYEPPRFAHGGDAIYVADHNSARWGKSEFLKTGITLSSLTYFSIAYDYLIKSGLSDLEIRQVYKFFCKSSGKKALKKWIPPAVLAVFKKILAK